MQLRRKLCALRRDNLLHRGCSSVSCRVSYTATNGRPKLAQARNGWGVSFSFAAANMKRFRRTSGEPVGFTLVDLPAVSERKRAAFTLVELLVVIAIIGILVALLLP